jgi:acetyl esterase/lipase
VFNIDYRLSKPGVKMYPESVHDVRAAVQFLRGSAVELKIDPAHIGMMGDSAGAHLAALVALAGDSPVFAGAYRDDRFAALSTKVRAVVGFYGAYDAIAVAARSDSPPERSDHPEVSRRIAARQSPPFLRRVTVELCHQG